MTPPDTQSSSLEQLWPCGPDCIHARTMPGSYGEWIWCEHPGADERMRRSGQECPRFQSTGGMPGTLEAPAGFSHRHQAASE